MTSSCGLGEEFSIIQNKTEGELILRKAVGISKSSSEIFQSDIQLFLENFISLNRSSQPTN